MLEKGAKKGNEERYQLFSADFWSQNIVEDLPGKWFHPKPLMPIQISVLLETYRNTGINWKRKKRLTLNVIFQILPLIDQEGTRSETATARASAEIYRWFNLLQLQLKIQFKKKKILQLQDSITIKDSF